LSRAILGGSLETLVTDLLHALGFGLITAALVGISAVALSLQYGVTNFANFAHGELLTVGAYAAYATQHWTTDLLVQVAVGAAVAAIVAVLINIVVIRPFVQTTARDPLGGHGSSLANHPRWPFLRIRTGQRRPETAD
jgi:branched-subunit amino acid ABC-type transport system permease component